jgi:hypothetical protein
LFVAAFSRKTAHTFAHAALTKRERRLGFAVNRIAIKVAALIAGLEQNWSR